MGEAQKDKQQYTFEEYLELEANSEFRHEYFEGEVFVKEKETSIAHNDLIGNLSSIFRTELCKTKYRVNFGSVKVEIQSGKQYSYPDIVVSSKEQVNDPNFVKSPILIANIFSSTFDRFNKLAKLLIRDINHSLKYIIIVHIKHCLIEFYYRREELWFIETFLDINDFVEIKELNIKISLKDIYEGIVFDETLKKK